MTNLSIITSTEMTMGTREIAEMLGKNHSDIKRSAERLWQSGVIGNGQPLAEREFKTERGNTYTEYLLIKRDSLILVAQNCPEFTAQIVDRWQELESQQGPQIPQTYAAALLEAGRLALEVEQKNHLLAVQAPKVAFADRVAGDDKGVNIGNYARAVGLGQNVLFRALREHRILMSGGNRHNLPFQDYIERGYFTVKEGTRTHNDETITTFTPMVTGKGQQWLTKRLIDLAYLKPIAA
ncbi:phage antirepressor KilAC domain-containing protein [Aeromonas veronii]|uniref:phage antirepressor KilAC domain-containing protein n=1 Tax=Aeromonas veronii TaxID=654 RepID=UPI001FD00CF2|nr:phage antirepressor KilAC domain-containing protein [Aeromonas veronii]MCJ7976746.1 phage antirepressor KilAC domain-containing protein [Aeromonas veronii]UOR20850.1 phage antirepressor KilAC domain-containing protein [Aeromonas veronii]